MKSSVMDALPKMYHQPIGPAAPRGMGCRSIGMRLLRTFSRASNQLPAASSQRFMVGCVSRLFQGVLPGRKVRRLDFQAEGPADPRHPSDVAVEPARRRAGGAFAIGVVDAAVAGAHE